MSESLTQLYLSNPALASALRRRQSAEQMQQQGMDTSPTSGWGALARLAQAYVGARDVGKADEQIKGIGDEQNQAIADFNKPVGAMPSPIPAPAAPQAAPATMGAAPSAPAAPQVAAADGLPPTPELSPIATPGGAKFQVAAPYADRFQGLLNDLEAAGYKSDPTQSGGYNRRFIAGTKTPSEHSHGAAIDVNWTRNPRGGTGDIPPELARSLAAKYNLTWGGDWSGSTRDPMHFEAPSSGRQTVAANAPAGVATDAGGSPTGSGGSAGPSGPPRASPLADVYLQQAMALQNKAQQAAASPIPQIRQQASILMQQAQLYASLAKEKPKTNVLRPGSQLVDDQGRVIASAPDDTGPLNVVQDGVDEKGNARWKYATRPSAVGMTAPTPGPLVNVDQRGQNAEAQERGLSLAKQAATIRDEASTAAGTIDQVRQLRNIGAETDRLAPAKEVVGSALEALGVKGSNAVKQATTLQQFNGSLSGLVLGAQLAQKGVQTEGDANRMREQYARMTNTMDANNFLMKATEAQATRKMEQHDFYENWYREHKTYDGASTGWNQFIREVPLTVKGPAGVVFYNEFANFARQQGASDEDIRAQWKARAGAK